LGEWYYTAVALRTFSRPYLLNPPQLDATLDSEAVSGASAFVQNGTPYTYFGDRPIAIGEQGTLTDGVLSVAIPKRISPIDVPTIAWRALSRRGHVAGHRQLHVATEVTRIQIRSRDDRPVPIQVDGDYIGDVAEIEFSVEPGALRVVC
jgi:diacylglycerol kinase family enzyme